MYFCILASVSVLYCMSWSTYLSSLLGYILVTRMYISVSMCLVFSYGLPQFVCELRYLFFSQLLSFYVYAYQYVRMSAPRVVLYLCLSISNFSTVLQLLGCHLVTFLSDTVSPCL
jgi:hypothetical protein